MESKQTLSKLEVTRKADTVTIHRWWSNAGRFMAFTVEEAREVSLLLQEVLHNDQGN